MIRVLFPRPLFRLQGGTVWRSQAVMARSVHGLATTSPHRSTHLLFELLSGMGMLCLPVWPLANARANKFAHATQRGLAFRHA